MINPLNTYKTKHKTAMRLFIILLLIGAIGCTPQRNYTYNISLEDPVKSDRLYYENDTMSIAFAFLPQFIKLDIYNKSNEGIRINWDELSMSVNGEAKRVVHKETGTYKITETQPPTTIPPKTKLVDGLIPTDNVKYYGGAGRTNSFVLLSNLYPVNDFGSNKTRSKILEKKGQRVTIYFPYYMRNEFHSKTFNFQINDIIEKKGSVSTK